jgi:AcrR family transcriptional regulator
VSPTSTDRAERRRELTEVAARVIARKGYAAARLSDVADEAGVSIGLLQHYFRSRDALMREAFSLVWSHQLDELASIVSTDAPAVVRLDSVLEWLFPDDPRSAVAESSLTLEYWMTATRDPELRKESQTIYLRWRETLQGLFEDGAASGEFHPRVPLDEAADGMLALIEGLMIRLLLRHPGIAPAGVRKIVRNHAAAVLGFG